MELRTVILFLHRFDKLVTYVSFILASVLGNRLVSPTIPTPSGLDSDGLRAIKVQFQFVYRFLEDLFPYPIVVAGVLIIMVIAKVLVIFWTPLLPWRLVSDFHAQHAEVPFGVVLDVVFDRFGREDFSRYERTVLRRFLVLCVTFLAFGALTAFGVWGSGKAAALGREDALVGQWLVVSSGVTFMTILYLFVIANFVNSFERGIWFPSRRR